MDIIIKLKMCKKCGSSDNKFKLHSYTCTKCLSKKNNAALNEKQFYKSYYEKNKEHLKQKAHENYIKKIEKKCLEIEIKIV